MNAAKAPTPLSPNQPRHLVLLFDGTGRSFKHNTNVTRVQQLLLDDCVPFYKSGPATNSIFERIGASITRAGIKKIIEEAYIFLSGNYCHSRGDTVAIFGYSRGAIVAKRLLGMVEEWGIIEKATPEYIRTIFHKVLNRSVTIVPRPATRISFVGLLDPVPGPRFFEPKRWSKYDTLLPSIVCSGLEIVALHEKRRTFAPRLWTAANTIFEPQITDKNSVLAPRSMPIIRILMPGNHGDIGGDESDEVIGILSLLTILDFYCASSGTTNVKTNSIIKTIDTLFQKDRFEINRDFNVHRFKTDSSFTFVHQLYYLITNRHTESTSAEYESPTYLTEIERFYQNGFPIRTKRELLSLLSNIVKRGSSFSRMH